MALDPINFLHSLMRYISDQNALPYMVAEGRRLWRGQVDETATGFPYTLAQLYPGPARLAGGNGAEAVAVQFSTVGIHDEAVRQAQLVFESLCNADGTARLGWTIPGYLAATPGTTADGNWRVIAVDHLQRPGVLGSAGDASQAQGRVRVVFNSEITFTRPAA